VTGSARALRAALLGAVAVLVLAGALLLVVPAGAGAGTSPSIHPVVVEAAQANLNGPNGHGEIGPASFGATFTRPTRRGDLLVAGIIDGVVTSGMPQPRWHLAGWRQGEDVIGGETATDGAGPAATGGLQASIWYWPDNPGGVTSVHFGSVPQGTASELTAVVVELSGVPASLQVVAEGSSTSGPRSATYTDESTVVATRAPSELPALVLAVFTNGGTSLDGEQFEHSPGWRVLGQDPNRHGLDQPILFDERVWATATPPHESMSYGETIDNCAAIVALG
jgi:hypothetical protein